MKRLYTHPVGLARELRKNSTPAERLLWSKLRNRNFLGVKFLRQYLIYYDIGVRGEPKFFITDFYSAQFKLIIELDGKIHDLTKEYDADRSKILMEMGYVIIRFNNEELDDIQDVLNRIEEKINALK